jgi:acetyl/propionyl-CoA carboxylase alpha subunit
VTEMVTGLDLVEHQLRVACGEALSDAVLRAASCGHAIEARIYAEDPSKGFIPKPGDITELTWPEGEGVRVDAGVRAPGKVTPFYDPMIAKIVARGPPREEAIDRLRRRPHRHDGAPLVSNLAFLRAVLRSRGVRRGPLPHGLRRGLREAPLTLARVSSPTSPWSLHRADSRSQSDDPPALEVPERAVPIHRDVVRQLGVGARAKAHRVGRGQVVDDLVAEEDAPPVGEQPPAKGAKIHDPHPPREGHQPVALLVGRASPHPTVV